MCVLDLPAMQPDLERQIAGIALLAEPIRRALYQYVAEQSHDVGREEAAKAVRVSRALAAFHLDKLVEMGLLEAGYRRLSGRSGPGAGRPSKVYRRSGLQLQVSLPQRSYELLARLLIQGFRREAGPSALREGARDAGRALGAEAGQLAGPRAGALLQLEAARLVLGRYGFEPSLEKGEIRLRNCPFDALAREHQDLVCRVNLWFMEGVLVGLGTDRLTAELEAEPGRCCVVFRRAGARGIRLREPRPT